MGVCVVACTGREPPGHLSHSRADACILPLQQFQQRCMMRHLHAWHLHAWRPHACTRAHGTAPSSRFEPAGPIPSHEAPLHEEPAAMGPSVGHRPWDLVGPQGCALLEAAAWMPDLPAEAWPSTRRGPLSGHGTGTHLYQSPHLHAAGFECSRFPLHPLCFAFNPLCFSI